MFSHVRLLHPRCVKVSFQTPYSVGIVACLKLLCSPCYIRFMMSVYRIDCWIMGEVLLCSILCLKCNESEEKWGEQHVNKETKRTHVSRFSRIWLCKYTGSIITPRPGLSFFPCPDTKSLKAPSGIQKKGSTISDHRNVKKYFFWVFELDNVCCLSTVMWFSSTAVVTCTQ